MKLYELTQEYETLADHLADAESPEDVQAITDTLEGIGGEIRVKVLNCARVFRQMETESSVVQAELDRLDARRKAREKAMAWLKKYMLDAMTSAGIDRADDELLTVAIQLNPPKVVLDQDATANSRILPLDYQKVKTIVELSRTKIREDLLAGKEVPHASLERERSLRIR